MSVSDYEKFSARVPLGQTEPLTHLLRPNHASAHMLDYLNRILDQLRIGG
jgi:hypothetical protein